MDSHCAIIDLSTDRISIRDGLGVVSREIIQADVKPVLKWAGGKQWLGPAAPYLIPGKFAGRYYEPFLGGGAFFFAVEPARATLSDRNEVLIATYKALRNDIDGVIQLLSRYPYDESFFYRMRAQSPRSECAIAARLLYLNRTCWNGLYRVNREGKFNTPFGRFKNPTICDPDRLRNAARLLRRAVISSGLKDDLQSFRGARNLVDHKVRHQRENAKREKQFAERMMQGPRLLADLISIKRKIK